MSKRIATRSMVCLALAASTPLWGRAAQEPVTEDTRLQEFLDVAGQVRELTATPGAAFAVVLEGEIAYVGGMGLRDVERALPVTESTLFAIGSCTKAMTGIVAGKLAEEGVVDWDAPAREALPALRFRDDYLTEHVNLRDLMAHRTGVGSYNMVWYGSGKDRVDLVAAVPHLHSYFSFRRQYAYNNLLYSVAGTLLERASETPWDTLVRQHVFEPLGMTQSVTSYAEFIAAPERSVGYDFDGTTPLPHLDIDVVGPAGAVGSTAQDMARWLDVIVGGGSTDEISLVPEAVFQDLTMPHVIVDAAEDVGYGIGWELHRRQGVRSIGHGGGIVGQNCYVHAVPERGFGIVILANQQSDFDDLLVRYAEELFVHGTLTRDEAWEARLVETRKTGELARTQARSLGPGLEVHPEHPCSLEAASYCGKYIHPAYEPIVISEAEEGGLRFTFNSFRGPVKHGRDELFIALPDPDDLGFQFHLRFEVDEERRVSGMNAGLDLGLPDAIFKLETEGAR